MDKMINILILDTGKEWGGGTVSLLELLKRVDRNKYNFTALFYRNYDRPNISNIKSEIEKFKIKFLLLEKEAQPLSAKILKEIGRVLFFFNKTLRKLFIFLIDYLFRTRIDASKISKIIKDLNIDLLYMNNNPSSNLEGILASKEAGIKSLLHSRFEAELNCFEIKAVNKWLTKTICVSVGLKDSFVRQGIDSPKCVSVHNGIDTSIKPAVSPESIKQELGIKENDLLIGSAGSLIKRKQFNHLISSLSYLQSSKNIESIKCLIIGEGPEKKSLQHEIEKKGLNNKVILAGFKTDVISYINALDIFVLTSEREGFSRVVIEAMLMGKPVIAPRIAGPSELVIENETGFLFKTGDIAQLSEYIFKLASSNEMRNMMGEAGKKRVINNFSIEKYVSQVSAVFSDLTASL